MILEALASYDLWIWHAFFRMPVNNNDLNKVYVSNFLSFTQWNHAPLHYSINGTTFSFGYYLVDGIYPDWPTFVKAICHPFEEKKIHFTMM
jgi:hypothetical protein